MSFDRLCDIHIDHQYYNDRNSKRLELKLIPSVESADLIRKRRITIRNNGSSFSFYGDAYTTKGDGSKELASEFMLSFAVVANDVYFTNASNVLQPVKEKDKAALYTLSQGNGQCIYYLHNKRTVLIDGKAYLSNAPVIGTDDMVPLRPTRFNKDELVELSDISVNSVIKYSADDELNSIFTYKADSNPAQPWEVKRSLEVNLNRFSSGHYTFTYKYRDPGNEWKDETASFYLDDHFAPLHPVAVIDLFFYSDIADNYRILDKDFYIVIGARKSTWRYNIISKYNTYEDKTIVSTPAGIFPVTGKLKTLKSGESATVFESLSELETRQISNNTLELNGKHVETLGIAISTTDGDEGEEEPSVSASATAGLIRLLPTPKAENLVFEKVTVGGKEEVKFFSDMFIYI